MFGNKGQGAMEYLMTYGWAILVVMIVGIVMWQLGIFGGTSTTIVSSGFAKIKPQLSGTGLSTAGAFEGVFTNGIGTTITLHDTGTTITESMSGGTCANIAFPSGTTAAAGSNFRVTADTCNGSTVNKGDPYMLVVTLNYTATIGTVQTTHTDSGSIRGPYE